LNKLYTDHKNRPIVAVTGMGVVTSLGQGIDDNWRALIQGQSGIHTITRFPTDLLNTKIAGTVDFMSESKSGASKLSMGLASAAAQEAIAQAGLGYEFGGPLFLAAPPVELEWQHRFALNKKLATATEAGYAALLSESCKNSYPDFFSATQFGSIADQLQTRFGTKGLPITLSTACASGTTAIQLGVEAIRRFEADRVLCIGTDGSVSAESLIRFSLLSALSTQNEHPQKAAKPFSKDRDGFVMAEGAGALVLESLQSAVSRGAKILGIIQGCGEKADDFHRTRSKPDASPAIAAVRAALDDAGVEESAIDYINAHGTSTPENDKMEFLAISTVFKDKFPPTSSNKSMIGHALTAAGAVEAVFSLLSMQNGILPPTINYDIPDPAIEMDCVPNIKRSTDISMTLSNSFGFGGQNSCLVMSREQF
jgi:3-oxoacyl-[acyl-carrier-protein] synthase II